jgi:hypothetical protein
VSVAIGPNLQLKRHQAEGSLAAVCCGMACCPYR